MVAASRYDQPVEWMPAPTEEADGFTDYRVFAWAGDRLLVEQSRGDSGPGDLVWAREPGHVKVVTPYGSLLGVSPDGSQVVYLEPRDYQGDGTYLWNTMLGDLAMGTSELLDTGGNSVSSMVWNGSTLTYQVSYDASWTIETSRLGPGGLVHEQRFDLDPRRVSYATDIFVAPDALIVAVAAASFQKDGIYPPGTTVLVTCQPTATACTYTPLDMTRGKFTSRITNPSRPLVTEAVSLVASGLSPGLFASQVSLMMPIRTARSTAWVRSRALSFS